MRTRRMDVNLVLSEHPRLNERDRKENGYAGQLAYALSRLRNGEI